MPRLTALLLLPPVALLTGCLALQGGSLEVLNPKHAYGRSVAVVGDLHGENEAIERRLASDLRDALAKRGLNVAEDPAKAEIVIVPTLGRMRDRAPAPVVNAAGPSPAEAAEPVTGEEPVVAAAAPEARPFHRFSAGNPLTRTEAVSRRAVPSARAPAAAQQAGLLLTGYRGEDFRDYGSGRQSLPPVWRIYVSQPAVQMKWNSVAVPLINTAASAARPLAGGKTEKEEGKVESERQEKAEPREKKKKSGEQGAGGVEQEMEREEKEKKKKPLFRFFGGSGEEPERAPEGNGSRPTGDRPE